MKFIYVNCTHEKQKKEQHGDNIAPELKRCVALIVTHCLDKTAQASWPYFPIEFPLCILFLSLIHGSQHFLIKNKIILSTVYSYIYNAVSNELSTSGLLTRVPANLLRVFSTNSPPNACFSSYESLFVNTFQDTNTFCKEKASTHRQILPHWIW